MNQSTEFQSLNGQKIFKCLILKHFFLETTEVDTQNKH